MKSRLHGKCRVLSCVAFLGLLGLSVGGAHAAGPQRVYLANDDHTDYMWSADAETFHRVFVEQLDFNLDLIEQTADRAPPFRARFNTDGSFWLWNYERRKSPAEFQRLIGRIKDGSLGSPLNTLVLTYGAQPLEAVLRGLYYGGRLERRHGLNFQTANATENQTLPRGLASLFAGSGAHYHSRGVCACASRIPIPVLKERPTEVYWAVGADGQRQLMKWYSVGPYAIGTYTEAGEPEKAVEWTRTDPGFLRRHVDPVTGLPLQVIGLLGYGGDDLARKTGVPPPPAIPAVPGLQGVPSSPYTDHFHLLAESLSTPQRQLNTSNTLDYLKDYERTHGANLVSRSVTHGNEWDLYSASMSETSARVKRAVERLRSAELVASLVSLKYPAFMNLHRAPRDQAYTDLALFYEHNWTADGPVSRGQRAGWQNQMAASFEGYVEGLLDEGLTRLGSLIPRPDVNGKPANRFFVLNPLGWARSDVVDHLHTGSADVHVHDLSSGLDVPHQIIRRGDARLIRLRAPEVPAAGYKVFEIRPGPGRLPPSGRAGPLTADPARGVLENAHVRLRLARDGALTSLVDKRRRGGELAAQIDGLWLNDIAPNSDAGEPLRLENSGPISATLVARSDAGLPHQTRITIYRDSARVDIDNRITANFSDTRHWGFSFALPQPAVRSEEIGAINLNKTESEGGHYADTHGRYDYLSVNHFADVCTGDGQRGVTLSNPDLAFGRLGRSTPAKLDTATPQISMLAGGQVDGPNLGIRQQNGQSQFTQRFALQPHGGWDPLAAMRMAMEHQNPLIAAPLRGMRSNGSSPAPGVPGSYPVDRFSLVTVDDPRLLLWALKPADDGIEHGLSLRLWNLADEPVQGSVSLTGGIASAVRSRHTESPLEPVTLRADGRLPSMHARQQLQTYVVRPKAAASIAP
jgi:alpha-mannosidase